MVPFDTIQNQIDKDVVDRVLQFYDNEDLDKYDLSKMEPIITCGGFTVCFNRDDNKVYYIDDDIVEEVEPILILKYNKDFDCIAEDGHVMTDKEFRDIDLKLNTNICGEADDMKSYLYFKFVEKDA